jgi:plasmid replication initiation protein
MPACTMIMINGGTDKHEAIQLQIGKGAIKNLFQTGENSWWERFGKDEYY